VPPGLPQRLRVEEEGAGHGRRHLFSSSYGGCLGERRSSLRRAQRSRFALLFFLALERLGEEGRPREGVC
jgi:hypothetical protein